MKGILPTFRHAAPFVVLAAALSTVTPASADGLPLASVAAVPLTRPTAASSFDGVVEAVRQSVLAAQVSGAVVALNVKPGDRVKAGQVLVRLDARAAEQQAGAAAAQVQAAHAAQEAATKEFVRQKQLFQKNYISHAALDKAEADYKAAQASSAALLAAADAARTQSGFYVVKAPYAGVVSVVPVVLGDMAMPGRPLITLYDPSEMRVTAPIPQSAASSLGKRIGLQAELPGLGRIVPASWELLPAVDPGTHTQMLRMALPAGTQAAPGLFARAWLPAAIAAGSRVSVPTQAVVRRAELISVYVVGPDGRPLLRQVRLGRMIGDHVEVLSGVAAGEKVALDPQAAARIR